MPPRAKPRPGAPAAEPDDLPPRRRAAGVARSPVKAEADTISAGAKSRVRVRRTAETDGVPTRAAAPAAAVPGAKPPAARPRRTKLMPARDVRPFLEALARAFPDAQSELTYETPWTLLVAVVLSAQTTDAAVNRCTPALFAAAPTPEAMARLGPEGVARHIRSIGLWQAKARNVVELSRLLVERHGGEVPADRAALEALPGVGRKTANVVLNVAFGQDTMAVDTHIFRLGNRTGLAPGANVRAVEDGLVHRIPPEMLRPAHHWLILHGRYVCKARRPECWRCPAAEWCAYPDKTPAPGPGAKAAPARKAASPAEEGP